MHQRTRTQLFLPLFFTSCFGLYLCRAESRSCWDDNKQNHVIKPLSPRLLNKLACREESRSNVKTLLKPLLTTRVPDTQGLRRAAKYIITTLKKLGWTVERWTSTQDTVLGQKTFTNIVATFNPDSPRRLVIAAHYDTKITPVGFIGAIDSAVPCAMMLDIANMTDFLKLRSRKKTPEISLQLIFFDGEEAFKSWTDTDSLYGSRDLADKWNKKTYQVDPNLGFCQSGSATYLDRIDAFVLLDLIGAKNPVFRKFNNYNMKLFEGLERIEDALNIGTGCYDISRVLDTTPQPGFIQDDHIPFYDLGVRNILHLISSPFPPQWHRLEDNEANLDYPTIEYVQKMVKLYIYQYLQ